MKIDYIFLIRWLIIGVGIGLLVYYALDKMVGIGWILGYTFAIVFSKIHEKIKRVD